MNRLVPFLFLVWGMLVLPPFSIQAQDNAIHLDQLSSIKRALQVDPRALKNAAELKLRDPALDKNSSEWVRSFVAFTIAVNELGTLDPLHQRYDDLERAMRQALELKLYEEYVLLGYVWIFVPDQAGKIRDELSNLNNLVKFADKYNIPSARIKSRMDLAYNLREKGDPKQALILLNEMNDILQQNPDIDLVDRLIVQNQSANTFIKQGQPEQAFAIHESIATVCRKEGLNYLGSIMENHLGDSFLNRGDELSLDQAEMHYRNALQITKKQTNEWLEATVSLNLARIHIQRLEWDRAMSLADRSSQLFLANDDLVGHADALYSQALIASENKQWKTALGYLELSEKAYAANGYKENLREIMELRSRIQEGMGDIRKALDLLKRFVQDTKKQTQEANQKNFSEMLVNMGLKVEVEKNKALQTENELQAQEISASRKIRTAFVVAIILAFGILALLLQVAKRSRLIAESKLKIQRIMDHIEEGIFTINSHLHIEGESSAFLQQIFEMKEAPTGHDALDVLLGQSQLNAEERSMVREVLKACIHEEKLAFELNEAHLPRELTLHGETIRVVLVHWTPLYDKDKKIHGFLVNLHDQTETRRLAAAVEAEKTKSQEREQRILEIVRAERASLRKVFADSHRVLDILAQPILTEDEIQDTFRDLHTIKGVSRTLGMRTLSLGSHVLEGKLLLIRDQSRTDPERWIKHLEHFRLIVKDYESLVEQIEQGSVAHHLEDGNLAREVGRHQNMVVKLLKRQNINCDSFDVIDEVVNWPEDLLGSVGELLVHSLTNSVDHGFNLPRVRGLVVHSARFVIKAAPTADGVMIEIQDNGKGLDLDLLKALAKQRAWSGETFAELTPMLFLDGLSTAEKATATSGRGIGLAAIRSIAEKWGGTAELMPNEAGTGCRLTICLRSLSTLAASA